MFFFIGNRSVRRPVTRVARDEKAMGHTGETMRLSRGSVKSGQKNFQWERSQRVHFSLAVSVVSTETDPQIEPKVFPFTLGMPSCESRNAEQIAMCDTANRKNSLFLTSIAIVGVVGWVWCQTTEKACVFMVPKKYRFFFKKVFLWRNWEIWRNLSWRKITCRNANLISVKIVSMETDTQIAPKVFPFTSGMPSCERRNHGQIVMCDTLDISKKFRAFGYWFLSPS